ncbi:hypothetical protein AYL99_00564 [Fonsecaea erecta]|uniref:Uncharacterized protein n=1 Tax=Fonsecaea erecta TaxID=1367422 RepID=A0A178ZY18_9EURO|nr:hypothetical protein AYL99_00564 [Fonsecaea erecta]OAP64592.1 hypothetical protein AYL99_00564 [Fonsecaea erecta]
MDAFIEKDQAPATNHSCFQAEVQCHHQQTNRQAYHPRCHHRPSNDNNINNHHKPARSCHCYRCQKSRGEPALHPAISIPLAIATGGLSCAAMGIYRGYAGHRTLKRSRNVSLEEAPRHNIDITHEQEVGFHSVSSRAGSSEMESPSSTGGMGGHDAGLGADVPDAAPPKYSEVEEDNVVRDVAEKM